MSQRSHAPSSADAPECADLVSSRLRQENHEQPVSPPTLQFEDGPSHTFDVSTWTSEEFRREKSPYYPVYQLCVVRPKTTTFIVDFYPRSGIIKAIREA